MAARTLVLCFQHGSLFPLVPSCFYCDVEFRPGACLSRPGPVCGPGLHNNLRPLGHFDLLLQVPLHTTQPGLYLCRSVSVCPAITDAQNLFEWLCTELCLLACFMVKALIPCTNSLVILNQLLRVARQSLRSVAESLALRPRPVRHRTRYAGGGDLVNDV